jgi:2-polyprenyl-3-methyl-5-hydroxy-6-metoxy-1,4-benzoquinol methylase
LSGSSQPCCLICASPRQSVRYRLTRFTVRECAQCRQVYLWPLPEPDEIREMFSRLYTTGEGSVPELRSYYGFCYEDDPDNPLVQLYERWLDVLERHRSPGRLLDIGCGTGLFLAVARRRGWDPFGIDDCPEAIRHAQQHFGLDVWLGDFSGFPEDERRFDAITGWDIIEHSRAPLELLRAVRSHLADGGIVGLSTPNQRSVLDVVAGLLYRLSRGRITAPLEKFYIEQHFLYFTPRTLQQTLNRAGLQQIHSARELTDLRRLTLSPATRLGLYGLFGIARLTGLENRLFTIASGSEEAGRGRP